MPSQFQFSFSPLAMFQCAWAHRRLIVRLTKREIEARYRGSILGLGWAIANPLLLLAVYTFVFSVVFKARWDIAENNRGNFALILFAGLILFNILAECLTRAPTLLLSHTTYIKKVVFPLEVLSIVSLLSALVNALISLVIFLLFHSVLIGTPPPSALLAPVVILPLVVTTLGISWVLSSVGLFIRDLQHVVGLLTMVLMFMSPLFYPLSALPERFRLLVQFNPLTMAIEQLRSVLFGLGTFDLTLYFISLVCALAFCWAGYLWFTFTRRGFSDVV